VTCASAPVVNVTGAAARACALRRCRWLLKAALTAAVVFAVQLPGLPPFARSCLYVLGGFPTAAAQLLEHTQACCPAGCLATAASDPAAGHDTPAKTGNRPASVQQWYRCTAGLYTMLGVVMDGPAALVLRPLRLNLAPHFLPPWESRSLAAFWCAAAAASERRRPLPPPARPLRRLLASRSCS
jgi:hypothetical protein